MDAMVLKPPRKKSMTWRMILMIVAVVVVLGIVLVWPMRSFLIPMIMGGGGGEEEPAPVVSTIVTHYEDWQPNIQVVGTLKAVQGADLAFEVSGVVDKVYFDSGRDVRAGDPLISLRAGDDVARLHTLQAAENLAQTNYARAQRLWSIKGISQQQVQEYAAALASARAQVAEAQALLNKKVMRAPFAGHLGLRRVNVGDYVNPGVPAVTLQTLDPIFLDFSVPQQQIAFMQAGQAVIARFDAYPGKSFSGQVTSIDPKADPDTRNVLARATIVNPDRRLVPGMYASVSVENGTAKPFLTLPQTAVTYNPYGDTVYTVDQEPPKNGKPGHLIAHQRFVKTGETRGDQVQILSGIKAGDVVITAGQFKIQNNGPVAINNNLHPTNDPNAQPREQ